jgi:GR25 family glycosyltransferase involved in LPS biosynthesis
MKIGITVNFQFSFFSSGNPQTALALGEIYRVQGHDVVFVNTGEAGKTWWDDIQTMKSAWDSVDAANAAEAQHFDCVIEVGNLLLTEKQRTDKKAKYVWLCRKPPIFNDIESSLFPFTLSGRNLTGVSEVWAYEEMCTKDDIQYMELLTRKPVVIIPYIWTPTAVEMYRKETQAPIWQQTSRPDVPWSIHICETNMSSSSSATIPLLVMREVKKSGVVNVNTNIKIHNADNIKDNEFFKNNVLAHVFSDITDMSGQFVGRQRIVDWAYDTNSVVIAHSRFLTIRPYHFDCVWSGIPLIHNSSNLQKLGGIVSKGFYTDNQISEAAAAFAEVISGDKGVEGLIQVRKNILDIFSPLSGTLQKRYIDALLINRASAPAPAETCASLEKKVLRVGFTCMWDSFVPEYNMFTLMLEEAVKEFPDDVRPCVKGVCVDSFVGEADNIDILIFGPFGDRWKTVSSAIPKIHYTGENTEAIIRDDVKLNLGYKHVDMNDGSYLRLPLWMLEINWFRADAEKIGNPKPLPIDRCCKVFPEEAGDKKKFCAFVVTNPRQPVRNSAFHWLSQYKPVDSAGRLFNNVGSDIFAGLGGGGGELIKHEFLKGYKFCLAYENERSDGYMTEKWLHAKAAGCIPIYWGDPKADRDFDMDSCIDAREVATPGELVELVRAVDTNDAEWKRRLMKPALDDVRRDLVRRTLSECARRILAAAGLASDALDKIPRFLGYTCDGVVKSGAVTTVSMDKTVFVTGCNTRFLPSLQIWLGSLSDHKKAVSELQVIVYLMGDVSEDVEGILKKTYAFANFRRIAGGGGGGGGASPGDFPDIWAPEHFAWKLWILKEVCGDASLAGLPLLYMDTGAMMCRWPRAWLARVRENGVCLLEDPRQKNKQWCHDVFIQKLGVTAAELEENQLWAGAISCIIGHPLACRLFEEAWRWGQVRDVIVGAKWGGVRDGAPYGHRHDQSILSVLSSRMKIPRHPLDDVYCDVSLRQTFMSKRSLYVHRSLFQEHAPVATDIDDAWVINLDRRADRMEKFARTHPDLAQRVHRFSAFEGSKLKLTPKIARLFKPNDFQWKKPVMGCALSHLALWMKLLNDKDDIKSYLILEDDARLSPTWKKSWEKIHKHNALPADWDVVYLGGILPPNKEAFHRSLIEPVNEYVARVKENTFFGQGKANRYMHFCAYAYVLSRMGAQKIVDVLKAKGGYWTSADHMICNIHDYMNIYFTNPLIAGCFQDDDPVYCNSQFNDFSRVDKFDSDLWNNTERFTEEEVFSASSSLVASSASASASASASELDIMGALADASASSSIAASPSALSSLATAQPSSLTAYPKDNRRRFVSICGPPMDMSKMYEYAWFKMIFPDDKYNLEVFSVETPPKDIPIVIVQAPHVSEIADKLATWSSAGATFYVLHLSDEYSADRVDFYDLPGCLGVIRNYLRKDVAENSKVSVIPLGFHWALPRCNPALNTPRPPFREFGWSFVGTGWAGRKEKLEVLNGIPDCKSKLVFMDEWNSPKMLGREESLGVLLNSWFVPCPAGNNAETYRIYEALEAGAVPVIVKEESNEEFLQLIGRYLPIMVCDNWAHAGQLIFTLLKNVELYEQYRNSLLNTWEQSKIRVKDTIMQVFKPVKDSTNDYTNVLICVCSKYPNPMLHRCIGNLYKYQINTEKTQRYKYTIHVVDSDSEDVSYYTDIRKDFPDVEIHMIKNKNYEYGAWKYIVNKYPSFDVYFCIQDSIFLERYIDLEVLDDKTAYTFHNRSGYNSHLSIKDAGMENLKGSGLNYMPIIDTDFNVAQHSSFIVNKKILEDIFKHLTIPPINKDGCCFYERNFGLYFIDKCIHTHDLYNYMMKISSLRT